MFKGYGDFKPKVGIALNMELAVVKLLNKLTGCEVIRSEQERDNPERLKYNLVDVVVLKNDGNPWFGVECKIGLEPYRRCMEFNGWSPDLNCPINRSSFKVYEDAKFPVYLLNYQKWTGELQAEDMKYIMKSDYETRGVCYKDTQIRNYDTTNWIRSKDVVKVLNTIIERVEGGRLC